MNELFDALALSLEQILSRYAPVGVQAARKAMQNISNPDKDMTEDLLKLQQLQRVLYVSAETTGALVEEISRSALDRIQEQRPSGEFSTEET